MRAIHLLPEIECRRVPVRCHIVQIRFDYCCRVIGIVQLLRHVAQVEARVDRPFGLPQLIWSQALKGRGIRDHCAGSERWAILN